MQLVRLYNKDVKAIMAKYNLKNEDIIGRGMFSIVFDNHNSTVTKLTIDNSSIRFAMQNISPHLPVIHKLIGTEKINKRSAYLYEIEKLQPKSSSVESNNIAHRLTQPNWHLPLSAKMLESIIPQDDEELGFVFDSLCVFFKEHNVLIDMNINNIMFRNETLVLNDIFVDANLFNSGYVRY